MFARKMKHNPKRLTAKALEPKRIPEAGGICKVTGSDRTFTLIGGKFTGYSSFFLLYLGLLTEKHKL